MFTQLKQAFRSLAPITEEDWQMIEPLLRVKQYRKGDYYLRAGDVEQQIGFVNSGSFRLYYVNPKGEEVNYHFFFEDRFVLGYYSLINSTPSKLHIQAMEDSEVVLLPKYPRIVEFYSRSHNWERFGRHIAEWAYTLTSDRVQDFLFNTAEERYVKLLKDQPDIFQRVSLSHISSYLGIQGPSLSRIRKRISKQ